MNCASQAWCASHAGAVTRLPSVTASSRSISGMVAPAASTSGKQVGKAEQVRPARTPAAARSCAPLLTAATGRPSSKKKRTIVSTSSSSLRYVVEPQVLRRTAAGNHERVVVLDHQVLERGIQGESVTRPLGVGLGAVELSDRGGDLLPGSLSRADSVHGVAERPEGLEGHHRPVTLGVVTGNHEDRSGHLLELNKCETSAEERAPRSSLHRTIPIVSGP